MARQKLGQHFLASEKVLRRIAGAVDGQRGSVALEIGPGRGALTEHLLRQFLRVVAIELDPELSAELLSRWQDRNQFQLIEGDALQVPWPGDAGVLAGNLPYYVATPLISRFLREHGSMTQAVFLIQKEVAERITAVPGTREYGYFSVECQFLAKAEYLFTVPPGAFRPPPRVESAVIRLTPQPLAEGTDASSFLTFASLCFRQKRKTLRNNLAPLYEVGDEPQMGKRAEQLSVPELVALHNALKRRALK